MTGRRITAGLSLLCALVFCAFTASSASAAGTSYFECVKGGGALDWAEGDCLKGVKAGTGEYGHKFLIDKISNKATITQKAGTTAKLMGTVGGITTTLTATGFSSKNATVENSARASKESAATGTGEGEYTGVTLSEGPEGCKVKGGTIKQQSTKSESVPASMEVEFKPVGASFAEFTFEGCKTAGLNVTYKVIGSANAIPNGAFIEFTEASTKNLKFGGQAAFFITADTVGLASGNALGLTTTTP